MISLLYTYRLLLVTLHYITNVPTDTSEEGGDVSIEVLQLDITMNKATTEKDTEGNKVTCKKINIDMIILFSWGGGVYEISITMFFNCYTRMPNIY